MNPKAWTKQPWENRIIEIDCSSTVPSGATISAAEAKVYDGAGTDVSSTMIQGTPSVSGTTVYVQVKAGTNAADYNLRIRLTLSNGEYAEDDITVFVREKGV